MTYDILSALIGFAFATSITPGPNNMMLLASGANFGLRRTVPHMLGISLGHALMVFLVGIGVAQVFHRYPQADLILKLAATIYMLWLAWKIANAAPRERARQRAAPLPLHRQRPFSGSIQRHGPWP